MPFEYFSFASWHNVKLCQEGHGGTLQWEGAFHPNAGVLILQDPQHRQFSLALFLQHAKILQSPAPAVQTPTSAPGSYSTCMWLSQHPAPVERAAPVLPADSQQPAAEAQVASQASSSCSAWKTAIYHIQKLLPAPQPISKKVPSERPLEQLSLYPREMIYSKFQRANFQQIPLMQLLLFHPVGHSHALFTISGSQPGGWEGAVRQRHTWASISAMGIIAAPYNCSSCTFRALFTYS